jgi:hypothetical protein
MRTLEGHFIEIHATVDGTGLSFDEGASRAKATCLATMGLLALVCGERVTGPLVLEDYVEVRADGEHGRDRIPGFVTQPRTVGETQLDAVDRGLPAAARADPKRVRSYTGAISRCGGTPRPQGRTPLLSALPLHSWP